VTAWRTDREVAVFLGDDLLPLLVLAFGAAMAIGSALALVRPPASRGEGDLAEASVGRSVVFIVIGTLATIWAVASLVVG
jgi:hypothetical protein